MKMVRGWKAIDAAAGRYINIAALAAIPLTLILLGHLLFTEFRQSLALREAVDRSYQTRLEIGRVLSLHQDIETGQRGYVLTGSTLFLAPYEAALPQVDSALQTLEGNLAGDQERLAQLEELRRLSAQKLAFTARTVDLRKRGDEQRAQALVASGRGKALMDALRANISSIDESEKQRLAAGTERADASRQRSQRLTFISLAVLALLLLAAAMANSRSMSAKRSALRRLEDVASRQEAVFTGATDGIITLNPSGSIETLNPAAAAMFGYGPDELLRRDVGLLFDIAPDRGRIESFLKRLRQSNVHMSRVREFWGRRSDGATFPCDVTISPFEVHGRQHYVAIIRDITERKQVEQMKSEFVSTVSHELRTPLTSIAGSLGLLAGGAAGALPDRAQRLIKIAHSNSERLVRLINDILDMEKIESGKMAFDVKPVPLAAFVEQAVLANQGFAAEHDAQLAAEPVPADATVMADPDRLMQVVTNLISNAVKFSPRGGKVSIAVRQLDRACRISVSDRGPGIPEEFRTRIFGKFAQADSSDTRRKGGTGLGLSIVREIVSRLGGSISFDSKTGEGTVFHVDLPVPRSQAAVQAKPAVLLADPDPQSAREICEAFRAAGLDCEIAANAAEVRERAGKREYSAIIIDLDLEKGDAAELLRFLESSEHMGRTPTMILAGGRSAESAGDRLPEAHRLDKPIATERLIESVQAALGPRFAGRRNILHVDDDPDVLRVVASAFENRANLYSVPSLEAARDALTQSRFDLVILDIALADGSGLELLPDLKQKGTTVPVVVFSAQDSDPELSRKVAAVLTKSRASLDQLVATVEKLANPSEDEA